MIDANQIDTANVFLVGGLGDGRLVINNQLKIRQALQPADAIILAAWLVAMSGEREAFLELLERVEES